MRVSAGSGGSPVATQFLKGRTRELALLDLVRIEAAHGEHPIAVMELTNMLNTIRCMEDLQRLAGYISGRFGHVVTHKTIWETEDARLLFPEGGREFIERIVATHANVSSNELAEATPIVAPSLRASRKELLKRDQAIRERNMPIPLRQYPAILCVMLTWLAAVPSLQAAILFCGGMLLHGLGLAVATPDGAPASRWRVLWRGVVTWSPVIGVFGICVALEPLSRRPMMPEALLDPWFTGGLLLVCGLASLLSLRDPSCGLADRLPGTRLVPK